MTTELANEGETSVAEQTRGRKQSLLGAFSLYHFQWCQMLYREDPGRTLAGPGLTNLKITFTGNTLFRVSYIQRERINIK